MHDDHLLHRRHHPGYGVFELQVCEHGKIFHLERDERSDKLVFMVNYNVDSSIRAPIFFSDAFARYHEPPDLST